AGGDVLSVEHVRRVQEAHPGCQVINGYGPTENTTFTCCHPVGRNEELGQGIPIGKPINNTRVYVLDSELEMTPIAAVGELYVAGAGLARGYLDRRALTSERFVADPYATEPGGRMYRTGDLVRWRAEGVLEFVGRVDHQVKIRGFRIELGEIEASLKAHPRVQDALVIVREQAEQKQLLGYVIPRQEEIEQSEAHTSFIQHWQQLYETTYRQGEADAGDFDI